MKRSAAVILAFLMLLLALSTSSESVPDSLSADGCAYEVVTERHTCS